MLALVTFFEKPPPPPLSASILILYVFFAAPSSSAVSLTCCIPRTHTHTHTPPFLPCSSSLTLRARTNQRIVGVFKNGKELFGPCGDVAIGGYYDIYQFNVLRSLLGVGVESACCSHGSNRQVEHVYDHRMRKSMNMR